MTEDCPFSMPLLSWGNGKPEGHKPCHPLSCQFGVLVGVPVTGSALQHLGHFQLTSDWPTEALERKKKKSILCICVVLFWVFCVCMCFFFSSSFICQSGCTWRYNWVVFCGSLGRNVRLVKIYVNVRNLTCGIPNWDAVKAERRNKCPWKLASCLPWMRMAKALILQMPVFAIHMH